MTRGLTGLTPDQQRAERIAFWCSLTYLVTLVVWSGVPVFFPLIVVAAKQLWPLAKMWKAGALRPTTRLRLGAVLTGFGLLWLAVAGAAAPWWSVTSVPDWFTEGYWRY